MSIFMKAVMNMCTKALFSNILVHRFKKSVIT